MYSLFLINVASTCISNPQQYCFNFIHVVHLFFHFLQSYYVCAYIQWLSHDSYFFWPKIWPCRKYMFEYMWHVLVNVIIRLGCTYWNARAFHMQALLHWQSHSEMEIAVFRVINTWEWWHI